jgi:raw
VSDSPYVFLGGSCNPTTWRRDIAIPMLDAAGVTYYNPQVEDWSPELVAIEAAVKDEAELLLFVIDSQTRAIASMLEATEYICTGRHVVLVIQDVSLRELAAVYAASAVEIKDLNRARDYLRDLATRHGVKIYPSVTAAIAGIVARAKADVR